MSFLLGSLGIVWHLVISSTAVSLMCAGAFIMSRAQVRDALILEKELIGPVH